MSEGTLVITKNDVKNTFTQMESQAVNFASRFITDSATRAMYMAKTKEMSNALLANIESGALTPRQAAEAANQLRNEIMEFARIKSSDLGRAKAKALKAQGLDLDRLTEKYA